MFYHQEAENILNKNKSGLTDFVYCLMQALVPQKILILHLSGLSMFRQIEFEGALSIEQEEELSNDTGRYNFMVADLPLNIKKVKSDLNPQGKVNKNWDLQQSHVSMKRRNFTYVLTLQLTSLKGNN